MVTLLLLYKGLRFVRPFGPFCLLDALCVTVLWVTLVFQKCFHRFGCCVLFGTTTELLPLGL